MVTQARLTLAAAGDMENRINVINPRFQAEALRMLRGRDVGVISGSFWSSSYPTGLYRTANPNKMWKCTVNSASDVAIGPGLATAYGFDLKSEETVHLGLGIPASGSKQYFIYLEWDLSSASEGKGYIKVHDNGTSTSWTPTYQNNLIDAPTGKYQMPLYRIQVTSSGVVTVYASWEALGVATIGYPLRAEHATHSETADGYSQTGGIKSKFDEIDGKLNRLGFRRGSIVFCGSTIDPDDTTAANASRGLFRQGNYVIGKLTFSDLSLNIYQALADGTLLGTFSTIFRPAKPELITLFATAEANFSPYGERCAALLRIKTDGTYEDVATTGDASAPFYRTMKSWRMCFGYEALPREE